MTVVETGATGPIVLPNAAIVAANARGVRKVDLTWKIL